MRLRLTSMTLLVLSLASCIHEIDVSALAASAGGDDVERAIVPGPVYAGDPASGGVYALDISFWEGSIAQQEMDCFWDSGVRHIVTGTQVEEITRQQLAMAVRRGMTVDAYVYLYWNEPIAAQVEEAFAIVDGFPIGRMWLDVEEAPGALGAAELTLLVEQAVAACRAHEGADDVECGIYTGPGFWRSAMNNTRAFADVPLWYAWYNHKRALSSWASEHFGGWAAPTAKQWAEEALCGVGPDKNTMLVGAAPTVVVDRTVPPDDGAAPPAPADLEPRDGSSTALEFVKLSCAPVPHATRYEFALETSREGATPAWVPYFTWSSPNAFRKVTPQFDNVTARFRARAKKGAAWGAWSEWSTFGFGRTLDDVPESPAEPPASEPPPSAPPPSAPPPSAPPPAANDAGAPTNLTPNGTTVTSSSVTLACAAVDGATRYRFAIETIDGAGVVRPYFTYEKPAPSATFWPQTRNVTYRFSVRALVDGAWGAAATASFERP